MDLVKLIDIELESSTVSEDTYSEYDDEHEYSTDDTVYVSYEDDGETERTPHEIYISLADSNTDNYPPDNATKWSLVGATNKWKMFDGYVNTQTEDTDTITVEVTADESNCVGLFETVGTTVTFTLTVDGSEIKTEEVDLDDSPVYDYYGYFFGEFSYKSDIFWTYPYYYEDSVLTISIATYNGEAKCGMVALGKSVKLGRTTWSPHISINDYSKKDTDSLGRTYLNQGSYAKTNEFDVWLETAEVDMVRRLLTEVRGEAIMTNANNELSDHESLIIYGFWKNFDIVIPGPNLSKCSLEIEGLI